MKKINSVKEAIREMDRIVSEFNTEDADYKYMARIRWNILSGMRIGGLAGLEDMPDGESCPCAFVCWMVTKRKEIGS